MNSVYVVWYDNGEPYEDNFQDIDCIFATRKLAEDYLDKNYTQREYDSYYGKEIYWVENAFECHMGESDPYACMDCPKFYDSKNYDGSKFVDEDGNETEVCQDSISLDELIYHNATYRIREEKLFNSVEDYEKSLTEH